MLTRIANPIYDAVFKYLMSDKKVAKLLLPAIIGKEIMSLDFRPTEHQLPVGKSLMVLRIDFSARVKDKHGEEQLIIIEIQKAKLSTDIMRFRRYLGEQYANKTNTYSSVKKDRSPRKALPILSIYFLGHKLNYSESPIIHVKRKCLDLTIQKELARKEAFIESLTHDSFIIQIPFLPGKRRTELEQLLSIFDQTAEDENPHFLNIREESFPKRYQPLVRRLKQALADPKVIKTMIAEDEIIEELKGYHRIISKKEKAIQENDKTIEHQTKTIETQTKTIENTIFELTKLGMNILQIAQIVGFPKEQVMAILNKN